MKPFAIRKFLENWTANQSRTIVLIDYANVDRWQRNLGWKVGVRELAQLAKSFSSVKALRRFYYGADYGKSTHSRTLTTWSAAILQGAQYNNLTLVTKRVKYIHETGEKKCNLDIEMAIDLMRFKKLYDNIILFSGDGDMACALEYMAKAYQKSAYVFGARDHIGSEIIDALSSGIVKKLFWAEDFEYRLSRRRLSGS